jgi:O-antigen ligase
MAVASGVNLTRFTVAADWLAGAVAASLPWSTSATSILIVLWLIALLPTLDIDEIRRDITIPAAGLPVLLFALSVIGTLWAEASWAERAESVTTFSRLLVIPLLFAQFRHSNRALCVFGGYLAACVALLLLSWLIAAWPALWWQRNEFAVPVKNAATQSGEFVTCIFGLLYLAVGYFERRQWAWLFGAVALALGMLANILYVATSRTALVIMPVLLVVFAIKKLSGRGIAILFIAATAIAVVGWLSSPYLRERTKDISSEIRKFEATGERTSSGERLEFWKRSIEFVRQAPIMGHGTGSIHPLFEKAAMGKTGAAGVASTNPHNQTLTVAIQLGLIGAAVLWALWIAHLLLFRGDGLVAWIGLAVVVQNIVGSLFNSHLFDFTQGWVYVFGVGVAGGMALKNRALERPHH